MFSHALSSASPNDPVPRSALPEPCRHARPPPRAAEAWASGSADIWQEDPAPGPHAGPPAHSPHEEP